MFDHEHARVLVVDDEATIRFTLEAILRRRGYIVTTAANGEEALAWLIQTSFELLLIDLKLPGIDGLEIARNAQECQPLPAILFLTGSTEFQGKPLEEHLGTFDCLRKTASPQEVLDRVASALLANP